jgi:hypothetical protein
MSTGWVALGISALGLAANADAANNARHDQDVRDEQIATQQTSEEGMHESTLAYYRERDAQSAGLQAQANAIAGRVADSQIATMDQQRVIAGEYHDRNKGIFWPLEDGLVSDAQAYDTPERRETAAGTAMADVGTQYGLARQSQDRSLTRMGVNPNSAKFGLAGNQMSLGLASAQSAAGKSARDQIEQQGWARRMDSASLGRGLASAQAQAASTGVSAGNSAVNAAYAPVNAANASTAAMGNAMSNYSAGMSNAGRLGLQSMSGGSSGSGVGNSLLSLGGSLMGQYSAGQNNVQAGNLAYANNVSSQGGDGLGTFITANGW